MSDSPDVAPVFGEPIILADRLVIPCAGGDGGLEVELVALADLAGRLCLLDAFFDPARDGGRATAMIGDPALLAGLKEALAAHGLPARSLAWLDAAAQDEHCFAFEAGSDLAAAVLDRQAGPPRVAA